MHEWFLGTQSFIFIEFLHGDSTRWQGMKQDLRPNWYQPFINHPVNERLYHTTGV